MYFSKKLPRLVLEKANISNSAHFRTTDFGYLLGNMMVITKNIVGVVQIYAVYIF